MQLRKRHMKGKAAQTGSVLIFTAAFVLPFLFFVFSLSIDFVKYTTESRQAQQVLDDAALFAYRFLPFTAEAEYAAHEYMRAHSRWANDVAVTITSDSITLILRSTSQLTFFRYFSQNAGIPLEAVSRARGIPVDALVLVDDSAYLGPANTDVPWGDVAAWPGSNFFARPDVFPGDVNKPDARNLTQRCFNPALVPMKRAAMRVTEYLSAFSKNAVGVGFFPGTAGSGTVDLVRSVIPEGTRPDRVQAEYFQMLSGSYAGNVYCSALAERENTDSPYALPRFNSRIDADLDVQARSTTDLVDSGFWTLNTDFLPLLTAQDLIWGRALGDGYVQDIGNVLASLTTHLILADGRVLRGDSLTNIRGGLTNRVVKAGIIFAGDLPRRSGQIFSDGSDEVENSIRAGLKVFDDALATLSEGDLSVPDSRLDGYLYYVLFNHQGTNRSLQDAHNLQDFFDAVVAEESLRFVHPKVLYSNSPEELVSSIVGPLVLENKTAVLAR